MGDHTGTAPSLRPLRLLFWGLLVVVVDLRLDGIDLVPDPAGWLVALVAATRLGHWHRGFLLAASGCVVGLLVSLPDWVEPGLAWVQPGTTLAQTAVVFGTCTALTALLPARRSGANAIRWWDLGAALATLPLLVPAADAAEAVWPLVLALGLVTLVVFVCFLVLVFRAARDTPEIGPEPA